MTDTPGRSRRDCGSAVVEFVLIGPVLVAVALAVVQVGMVAHARATLTLAAAEGARVGARAGAGPAVGMSRAASLAQSVSTARVDDVRAVRDTVDGLRVLTVRIDAAVPGPLGSVGVVVDAHALIEGGR